MSDELFVAPESDASAPSEPQVSAPQVTETTPVETPQPQIQAPVTPVAPSQPPLLEKFSQVLGGRWENEDQLIRDIYQLKAEREAMREYAEFGRQALPYRSEIQKWFQSQQAAQNPQAPAQPEAPSWRHGLENAQIARAIREFSDFHPDYQRFIPRPDAPQWAKDTLEKYQEWFETHKQNMFSDRADEYIEKMGFVRGDKIREEIERVREEVRAEITQQFAEREAAVRAQREFAGVQKKVYQHDANGRPVTDPVGRPLYTEWGRAFHSEVNRLERMGLTDPVEVRRLAEAVASRNEYDKLIATQRIEAEQRRAVGLPPQVASPVTRTAPAARGEAPLTPNMSLGAMLKASGFGDQDWDEMRQEIGAWTP